MATLTFVFLRMLAATMSIMIGGIGFQTRTQSHLAEIAKPDTNITSILSGSSAFSNVRPINPVLTYGAGMLTMWILFASVECWCIWRFR